MIDYTKTLTKKGAKEHEWEEVHKVRIKKIQREVENFKRQKREELKKLKRSYYERKED
jgi:hypothetical protein